jgi:hypothetical protein
LSITAGATGTAYLETSGNILVVSGTASIVISIVRNGSSIINRSEIVTTGNPKVWNAGAVSPVLIGDLFEVRVSSVSGSATASIGGTGLLSANLNFILIKP